jgi:hypothetical protein
MRLAIAVAATAVALAVPFAGPASATTCSADIGPLSCPVHATAAISWGFDSCYPGPGGVGYTCAIHWNLSYSGGGLGAGSVTLSKAGVFPVVGGCTWVVLDCSGVQTESDYIPVTTCGTVQQDFSLWVTASSVLGQATDIALGSARFTSPYGLC